MDDENNEEGMAMLFLPDILVARMEQVRRLVKEMKNSDEYQRELLSKSAAILLDSCDVKRQNLKLIERDTVPPLN